MRAGGVTRHFPGPNSTVRRIRPGKNTGPCPLTDAPVNIETRSDNVAVKDDFGHRQRRFHGDFGCYCDPEGAAR